MVFHYWLLKNDSASSHGRGWVSGHPFPSTHPSSSHQRIYIQLSANGCITRSSIQPQISVSTSNSISYRSQIVNVHILGVTMEKPRIWITGRMDQWYSEVEWSDGTRSGKYGPFKWKRRAERVAAHLHELWPSGFISMRAQFANMVSRLRELPF